MEMVIADADDLIERELMLNWFRRLMTELQRGAINRNLFQQWEIDLLLDIEGCQLERRRRADIIRQYVRAVERQLENGRGPPMKLPEFLASRGPTRTTVEQHAPRCDPVSAAEHNSDGFRTRCVAYFRTRERRVPATIRCQ
jgi:hypothetical protein